MAQGTIQRINSERGFGFIAPDGGNKDLFFHRSAVEGPSFGQLQEGQRVAFEAGADPRDPARMRAEHVKPVEE